MKSLSDVVKSSMNLVDRNSTGILTGVGTFGVISTALLTGQAVLKADKILKETHAERLKEDPGVADLDPMDVPDGRTWQTKAALTWHVFIPPVLSGAITITSIIMANRIASKETAAMMAMYTLSQQSFAEYKTKVVEKLGEVKEKDVRDQIAQDKISRTEGATEVIIAGAGEVLCFDALSGRYFQGSVEGIRQAENKINWELLNHDYTSLGHFYDLIGLPPTGYSDTVGWNVNERLEIKFSSAISTDQRPCISIDFSPAPKADYGRLY